MFRTTRNLKSPKWLPNRSLCEQTVKDTVKASIRLVILFGILVKKTEFGMHFVQSGHSLEARKVQIQTSLVCMWNVLHVILASSTCNVCDNIHKLSFRIVCTREEQSNDIPVTVSKRMFPIPRFSYFLLAQHQVLWCKTQYVVASGNTTYLLNVNLSIRTRHDFCINFTLIVLNWNNRRHGRGAYH